MKIIIVSVLVTVAVLLSVVGLRVSRVNDIDGHPNYAFMECGRCIKQLPFPGVPYSSNELVKPEGAAFVKAIKDAEDALSIGGKRIVTTAKSVNKSALVGCAWFVEAIQ